MKLADYYHVLGLNYGASVAEIKASYRRLARKYHPDVNREDKLAQSKFIELTDAYKLLLKVVQISGNPNPTAPSQAVKPEPEFKVKKDSPPTPKVTEKPPSVTVYPPLSAIEQQLKWSSYNHLQQLLKEKRFARAIALMEGLAQRIPQDPEIRQWHAIAYQCWGRHLVKERQLEKARIYLKKALKTDPHNRSLWAEIEMDFQRMERMF
ncbi:MAG TPA: molecular chaperone DnaJ [Cyanobacteria bacterium UBA11149]|nr:molecular chaperone DnaJ [Cyanobacteria bacterium UBA11367]HBE58952.1 molecular chaperone DnaJ [Cyanobacteria bacterium UBA11366]HBK63349.1 molecular chaperone DnaJ [Cyanobacteria bacterium UBA11166]HBR73066.1 molecular chaperone DnaJ [Cyanobacteria bacterium UBA11159]HBS70126.1 molecular chaperone DnaJ [Cyanobacteria bacterium UBA11153]HBW91766.1 molecular chaperone DnaJ [Cyanobacteria bacterium UBA11149]HCA95572.1 molecular chaperone DnaJ [Cyanobacteria bacterium UBA9226]